MLTRRDTRGSQILVHWPGCDDRWDEWREAASPSVALPAEMGESPRAASPRPRADLLDQNLGINSFVEPLGEPTDDAAVPPYHEASTFTLAGVATLQVNRSGAAPSAAVERTRGARARALRAARQRPAGRARAGSSRAPGQPGARQPGSAHIPRAHVPDVSRTQQACC